MKQNDSPQWIAAKAEGDCAELAIAEWFRGRGFEPYKTEGLAGFDLLLPCEVEINTTYRLLQPGTWQSKHATTDSRAGFSPAKQPGG